MLYYGMILRPSDQRVLIEGCIRSIPEVTACKEKVVKKIWAANLNPNERKKISTKNAGKWLSLSNDENIIGLFCVKADYPERLAYKAITVSPKFLSGVKIGDRRSMKE
jgi:hypothetical protein